MKPVIRRPRPLSFSMSEFYLDKTSTLQWKIKTSYYSSRSTVKSAGLRSDFSNRKSQTDS